MTNERETITITTPITQKVIVIKSYLTGLEKRAITNASIPTSIDYNNEDGVKGMNPVQIMNAAEDATLRNVIISIDGVEVSDVVNAILSLPSTDSDFVLKEVKNIVDGLTIEKKTI